MNLFFVKTWPTCQVLNCLIYPSPLSQLDDNPDVHVSGDYNGEYHCSLDKKWWMWDDQDNFLPTSDHTSWNEIRLFSSRRSPKPIALSPQNSARSWEYGATDDADTEATFHSITGGNFPYMQYIFQ